MKVKLTKEQIEAIAADPEKAGQAGVSLVKSASKYSASIV